MSEAPKTGESYADLIKKLDSAQVGDTVTVGTGGSGFIGKVIATHPNGLTIAPSFPDQVKDHHIEMGWGPDAPDEAFIYRVLKPGPQSGPEVVQPFRPSKKLVRVSVISGERKKPLLDL
jgi:hypothetical protein